jgi:hypothetical protein
MTAAPGPIEPAPGDPGAIDPGVIELAGRVFGLARAGATEELAAYVDAGVPVNLTNDKGDTLLVLAAYHAHPATVAALLARGADHSRVNDRGQTALGAAVFRRSEAAVRALLDAGADPDLGRQSARATATVFDLPDMLALLPEPRPDAGREPGNPA